MVFWILTPCSLVGEYQCFGGTWCLHLPGPFDPQVGVHFLLNVGINCYYTVSQSETESCYMCQGSLNVVGTVVEYMHFVQVHGDLTDGMLVVVKEVMDL